MPQEQDSDWNFKRLLLICNFFFFFFIPMLSSVNECVVLNRKKSRKKYNFNTENINKQVE